jgi:hypothetical protein
VVDVGRIALSSVVVEREAQVVLVWVGVDVVVVATLVLSAVVVERRAHVVVVTIILVALDVVKGQGACVFKIRFVLKGTVLQNS